MKKLKKVWRENSVLIVLLSILVACLIAISVVVITYFVGDSSSKYGERLDGIDKHEFSKSKQDEVVNKISEDKLVEKASVRVSGKIIYIVINYKTGTSIVEAQSSALATVELFDENILTFYDLEYMIKADSTEETEGFQIEGSHNINGTGGIVWNNNNKTTKDEE